MGITGLLPFLDKSSKRCNISEFSGGTVAIDSYCWLHKGAFSCADLLVLGQQSTQYVSYCMKYVTMLLSNNIKPILVFDGRNLPAKAGTESKRRENRESNKRKGAALLRAGQVEKGRSVLKRAVDVTHEMALNLIKECQKRNVDCVVAPFEADAQLAYFSINGIADVIITEDSDLLLFGCKKVLFKMDVNGNGVLVERDKLHLAMNVRYDNFSIDKFRYMCILSGCDYLPSLPGIGLSKACKFFNRCSEPDIEQALLKLPSNLNMWSLTVSDDYRRSFLEADLTFRCQLIFNPITRSEAPLTDPHVGEIPVGEGLGFPLAFQMALGNINPRNLKKVNDFDPDKPLKLNNIDKALRAPHKSIWSGDYNPSKRRLGTIPSMIIERGLTLNKVTPVTIKMPQKTMHEESDEDSNLDLVKLYSGTKDTTLTENKSYISASDTEDEKTEEDADANSDEPAEKPPFSIGSKKETVCSSRYFSFNSAKKDCSKTLTESDADSGFGSEESITCSSKRKLSEESDDIIEVQSQEENLPSKANVPVHVNKKILTVETAESVFFNKTPQTSRGIRVGLPKPKSSQSLLSKFGFVSQKKMV